MLDVDALVVPAGGDSARLLQGLLDLVGQLIQVRWRCKVRTVGQAVKPIGPGEGG